MKGKGKAKHRAVRLGAQPVASDALSRIIREFYCSLDTPVALSCLMLYTAGEYDQLVEKDIDPDSYNDFESFRLDLAAVSFLRKAEFLKTSFDREARAIQKFLEFEELCKRTNKRFKNLSDDPEFRGPCVWLLNAVTRKIEFILNRKSVRGTDTPAEHSWFGQSVGDTIEELASSADWGPGATTLIRGARTGPEVKFEQERHCSSHLYQLLVDTKFLETQYPAWRPFEKLEGCSGWADYLIPCKSGKLTTVPKNAKIDRVIKTEPGVNLWFQKGLGSMIRRRLRRCGLELNRAGLYDEFQGREGRNSALSRLGSRTGALTTVDFSGASDSISTEVVRQILPPAVYGLLDVTRSRWYTYKGVEVPMEKFSSMGNGFTFELESLIFFACALVCCEYLQLPTGDVSVFGDDVILPTPAYELFANFTTFLGFRVNLSKTCNTGYFRESCGTYWWNGRSVKPFYFKEGLPSATHLLRLANSIRLLAHRFTAMYGCDERFRGLYRMCVSFLEPELKKLKGPVGGGDGCLFSNFDEARPSKIPNWLEGYYYLALVETPLTYEETYTGVLVSRLRNRSEIAKGNACAIRNATRSRLKRLSAWQWYNLGPWTS